MRSGWPSGFGRAVRITVTRYARWPVGRFVRYQLANPRRRPGLVLNRYPGEVLGVVMHVGRRAYSWVWPLTLVTSAGAGPRRP